IASLNKAKEKAKLKTDLSDIYYNQGVIYQLNENLPECISAYKNALKLNPDNEDARQNLQKALRKQKDKEQEKNQKEQKNKSENKKPTSKLTKEDAENKLKALQQQEKNIREKMKKGEGEQGPSPVKDW
ncbi:MAG: tetratricopeptide repeat protein, partial [Ferruginibacter sp.]